MSKILLIEPEMKMSGRRFDPLGLCYISAYAKSLGHETRIFQQTDEPDSFVEDLFDDFDPDVVGFSCLDINAAEGLRLAKLLKDKKDVVTVFGGEHPTSHPEIAEDPAVDVAVIGEGEKTFEEILSRVSRGSAEFSGILGCAHYFGSRLVVEDRRPRMTNLDSLPFPDRDVIKNYDYLFPGLAGLTVPLHKQNIACVAMSRGCLGNCIFCTTPYVWMRKWVTRSPEGMVDELEILINERGVNLVYFQDETFTTKPETIIALCKEIIQRRLKFSWTCLTRISTLDGELLRWMKRAGCFYMAVGVEAASNETLEKIDKKLSVETIREKIGLLKANDISVCGLVMIGYPWETEAQIRSYSKVLNSLDLDSVRIRFLTPFKGTKLHEQIVEMGLLLSENPYHENTERPTIKMESVTPEQLIALRNWIQRRFYLRPGYIFKALARTFRHPSYLLGYIRSFWFFAKVHKHDRALLQDWEQAEQEG